MAVGLGFLLSVRLLIFFLPFRFLFLIYSSFPLSPLLQEEQEDLQGEEGRQEEGVSSGPIHPFFSLLLYLTLSRAPVDVF